VGDLINYFEVGQRSEAFVPQTFSKPSNALIRFNKRIHNLKRKDCTIQWTGQKRICLWSSHASRWEGFLRKGGQIYVERERVSLQKKKDLAPCLGANGALGPLTPVCIIML